MSGTIIRVGFLVLVAVVGADTLYAQPCNPDWHTQVGSPGVNAPVYALATFDDDGSGSNPPALYAGGSFTTAGGITASRVAKWNGSAWSRLGTSTNNGTNGVVYALTSVNQTSPLGPPALYVGGFFVKAGGSTVNSIAKWTGSWSGLGTGMDGGVNALTLFGGELYAGGTFTNAGGTPAARIARWNGSTWAALGAGLGTNHCSALTATDAASAVGPALYAGGNFGTAGGVTALCVAKWNGSAWSAVGDGITNGTNVSALAIYNDGTGSALYVGGNFVEAGSVSAQNIAKWNGITWSSIGDMNGEVFALAVYDDGTGPALYAGGAFTLAGGVSAQYVARWNGSTWAPLEGTAGQGTSYFVWALGVATETSPVGPGLYVGGEFTSAGGETANYVAQWGCIPMDCDGDGDIDRADHTTFAGCMTGPGGGPVPSQCQCADADRDNDVDLADWSKFQQSYTGSL